MATDLLELADRLCGAATPTSPSTTPSDLFGELAELGPASGHSWPRSPTSPRSRPSDGMVLVDTSSPFLAGRVHDVLAEWRDDPLHTAVFTHGHIDHVFGVERYEQDAREQGAVRAPGGRARGSSRRASTATSRPPGYNAVINRRQFGARRLRWPTDYRYPDETYRELAAPRRRRHARSSCTTRAARPTTTRGCGCPDSRTLCTGDLFIWASPNCGNPQKVQRYAEGVGRRAARRWPTLERGDRCSPGTGCRSSAPTGYARRSTTRPPCSRACTTTRSG